jgi:hypothetical protein
VPERLAVTVYPTMTESDNLTAPDALRQVLDIVELLAKAEAYQEGGPNKIVWRLTSASANSPFTVELEATAHMPDVSISLQALRVKQIVRGAVSSILDGGSRADWLDNGAGRTLKSILQRNLNGVGRTDIDFRNSADPIVIVHASAKRAVLALEMAELDEELKDDDLTHVEYGALEGEVMSTGLHHSRPAVFLKERLSGERVICVLSAEIAERIGPEHSWLEVWTGRRTLVSGAVYYDQEGVARRVHAENVETFVVPEVALNEIRDSDFTGGMSPLNFLNHARGDGG